MPNDTDGSAERLDSWKDIATYLRRDVSTVQRWEKREAMPVHRHLHEKLRSVYAFRSELDAWSRGRGIHVAQHEAHGSVTHELPPPHLAAAVTSSWRLAAAVGALALLIAIAVVIKGSRARGGGTNNHESSATRMAEAQDLVSRARYLSDRTTNADNKSAIALLEQAIALDPTLARAYARLASAYVTRLAYVTPEETHELEQKSYAAAEKAFSLDPNLPEVYLARGDLLWTHSYRFAHQRAIQLFRRALGLNPKSYQAHRRIARVLVHVRFFEEARQHADRALAAYPSNSQALNTRAQSLLWDGRVEEPWRSCSASQRPVLP